jgi:hypothetical protein
MKQVTSEMKQQQIDWRRAKVLEQSSQGYTEREIAERLQPIAPVTVHRDLIPETTGPTKPSKTYQRSGPRRIPKMHGWNEA